MSAQMDAMTRGAAQGSAVGMSRREREFAATWQDSNGRFLRDYLEGVPRELADAYVLARSVEYALSWTRTSTDPAFLRARDEARAAGERVDASKAGVGAVSL